MSIRRNRLRQLINEIAAEDSGGLPRANELARKLSAAGPEAALGFLADLMSQLKFDAAAPATPAPAPMPEPLPEDL